MSLRNHNRIYITIYALVLLVLSMSLFSCTEPDPFPETPKIEFAGLKFVELDQNGMFDSLVLSFDFEDGNGDLGLRSDDNTYPYQDLSYIIDSVQTNSSGNATDFRFVTYQMNEVYPPFYYLAATTTGGIFDFFSEEDNRPSYSCVDYEIESDTINSIITSDTLYITRNENRYNIYVRFFRDRGEGFEEFDFIDREPFSCGIPFHGRFPILDAENIGTSLQGTIKYSMTSLGWVQVLREFPFKLKFYIYDRSLNKSNEVETPEFKLADITE
ncbi:MAG: hypothetical protein OCD76_05555 [Reichenbachiella sp.]